MNSDLHWWSILYTAEGIIFRIGPFDNPAQANAAARQAQAQGEFDVRDQRVYLLSGAHNLIELVDDDLLSPAELVERGSLS